MGLGAWGYRWMESSLALDNLDPTLLMWDMRRGIDAAPFPAGRSTIQFVYPELPSSHRDYWLVIDDGTVDICWVDPGFDVDLWVSSPLRVMTAVWMGYANLKAEMSAGRITVDGDPRLAGSMPVGSALAPSRASRMQRGMVGSINVAVYRGSIIRPWWGDCSSSADEGLSLGAFTWLRWVDSKINQDDQVLIP